LRALREVEVAGWGPLGFERAFRKAFLNDSKLTGSGGRVD
tara:strand:- start:48 stop:167 length:120 start_codon:yes stop_codon:yes gene_type:complete